MKINDLLSHSLTSRVPAIVCKEPLVGSELFNQLRSEAGAALKRKFTVLDPTSLYEKLEKLVWEIADSEDPGKWIEHLSGLIPLEMLEKILQSRHPGQVGALETAKELVEDARHFFKMIDGQPVYSWKARMEAFFDICVSVLESFLNAFGIAEFFRPADSFLENDIKSNRVMQLLMLFSTVSTLLLPVLGAALATSIVGGTILGTTGLSLVFPYIRPAPSYLPKAINWTKQYRQGELLTSSCKKETLDAIAAALTSSDRIKTHPMLIGKSGAGKTEMAKAFVRAVEQGDYPELSGKKIFYLNTADLVKGAEALSGENKTLANLDRAMGSHRDNIILIFDEIQLACQKESRTLGEQLKTLLDPGNSRFPHVIGITTEEEYYRDIYRNNAAFARRFKRINVESPTQIETVAILTNTALETAPEVPIAEGAMQELVERTKIAYSEAPEPITSLKILTRCLQKAAASQTSPLARQAEALRMEIGALHAERAATLLPHSHREEIARLERDLKAVVRAEEVEDRNLTRFFERRGELLALKKRIFGKALSAASLTEKQLAAFLLETHFLMPMRTEYLICDAKRLGLKAALDGPLIQEAIDEELESDRKAAEAVERGRAGLQSRT